MNNSVYLHSLEKMGIVPNFFCSEEFKLRAGIQELTKGGWVYWDWDGMVVHPPLPIGEKFSCPTSDIANTIWSDFENLSAPPNYTPKFLDYEFIFDPQSFLHMEGGHWQVFRKNCRKFPRRFQDNLKYDWISRYVEEFGSFKAETELNGLFIEWLKSKPKDEEIQGDEIMANYLQHGANRKVLYANKGPIYGINIWDANYKYINFRFTFNRPEDFISEYLRILFYTDPVILKTGKLVNDGGCVGSESLRKFKLKMNPVKVREVRGWSKGE